MLASNAQADSAFFLLTPEGDPIRNFSIPGNLMPSDLPGVIVLGDTSAPILYEFFDYACPYCRIAYQELDVLLGPKAGFRLGLVHHPVVGANSKQLALMVLAAQSEWGDGVAAQLHHRFMDGPARLAPERAWVLVKSMGLDIQKLQARMQDASIEHQLQAQTARALKLGLRMTPVFVLGHYAFVGWPGIDVVGDVLRAYRQCQALVCRQT
jgi:protein-disulfide isomerase